MNQSFYMLEMGSIQTHMYELSRFPGGGFPPGHLHFALAEVETRIHENRIRPGLDPNHPHEVGIRVVNVHNADQLSCPYLEFCHPDVTYFEFSQLLLKFSELVQAPSLRPHSDLTATSPAQERKKRNYRGFFASNCNRVSCTRSSASSF